MHMKMYVSFDKTIFFFFALLFTVLRLATSTEHEYGYKTSVHIFEFPRSFVKSCFVDFLAFAVTTNRIKTEQRRHLKFCS